MDDPRPKPETGYHGVVEHHKWHGHFWARICVGGRGESKRVKLGLFKDPVEAARVYDAVKRVVAKMGMFRLNFPRERLPEGWTEEDLLLFIYEKGLGAYVKNGRLRSEVKRDESVTDTG